MKDEEINTKVSAQSLLLCLFCWPYRKVRSTGDCSGSLIINLHHRHCKTVFFFPLLFLGYVTKHITQDKIYLLNFF